MKCLYALLLAAAGAPLAAAAQADGAPPFRSAFAAYQRTPDTLQTPDQVWRGANRDVAATSHAMGHMGQVNPGAMEHRQEDHGAMRHGSGAPAAHEHGKMDQSKMDHSKMDHSKMNHGQMDHGQVKHGEPDAPAQPAPAQHPHKEH